jgi:hypothetical protein
VKKKTWWTWLTEYLRDWRLQADAWFQSWMQQRYIKMQVQALTAREMSERQWRQEAEREVAALEKTIETLKAARHEPLPEAKKLLYLINDMLAPIWSESGRPINNYELKSWQADYRDFKRRNP